MALGPGTYLTSFHPKEGKDTIAEDCWCGPNEEKMKYVICITEWPKDLEQPDKWTNVRKACYVFRNSAIDLSSFTWCFGKFEE